MCTFCVFGSNRGCYYRDELTGEAALSRQISQHMLVSTLCDFFCLGVTMPVSHCRLSSSLLTSTGVSVSPPETLLRWWGTNICERPKPLRESLSSLLSHRWSAPNYLCLRLNVDYSVSPVFTPTVVGLLLCDRDSDVAGQCSGQTAEAALPDCWRVCVRRPARFHQLRFIQPSKKPCH